MANNYCRAVPLRVGLGLFMAAAIVSTLDVFAGEIANWVQGFLGS